MISKHIDELIRKPHKFGQFLGFNKLSDIHSEWIKHLWLSPKDSALQAHRNSYKTTSVIMVGAIWYLLQYPEKRILILREETSNAEKTLSAIASLYDTEEMKWLYKQLFGIDNIKTNQWSSRSIRLSTKKQPTPEGNIEAKGMTSSLTGSHYEIICPDDIITKNDRYSKAKRELTKGVIFELKNIKTADGKIQSSGTPWHPDDGHQYLPEPLIYRISDDIWRIKGFTPEVAEDIKKTTPTALWAANYELKHVADEGRIFDDPQYEDFPEDMKLMSVLDTAFGGGNNTALALGGIHNGTIYLTGRSWNESVSSIHDQILIEVDNWSAGTLFVEDNADKGSTTKSLREKRGTKGLVTGYHESGNKHAKIMSNLHENWHRVKFHPDTPKDFIYNILEYQEDFGIDDEADACATLIKKLTAPIRKTTVRTLSI